MNAIQGLPGRHRKAGHEHPGPRSCAELLVHCTAPSRDLARAHLGRTLLGFGWAREWPDTWEGPQDIDSGAVVPVLQAAPGASGHALVAARSFGDEAFHASLLASLELAAFPTWEGDQLAYAASNAVGDAVLLYGLTAGPVWDRVGGAA